MSKETCPHCGKEYARLATHIKHCKSNPEYYNISTPEYDTVSYDVATTNTPEEFTSDDEPSEKQDKPCPYLVIIAGDGCSSCRGTSCMARKDKKISDQDYCKYYWNDCLIYEEAIEKGVRTVCPYFGPPPEGKKSCTGNYCYAIPGVVRVVKACYRYSDCTDFLLSQFEGKPFYRSRVK